MLSFSELDRLWSLQLSTWIFFKTSFYPHTLYLFSFCFFPVFWTPIIWWQTVYHVLILSLHIFFFFCISSDKLYLCVWSVYFLFSWLCNLNASLPLMKLTLYGLQTQTNNNLHISTVTPQEYWHSLPLLLTLHLFFICSLHSITNFIAFLTLPSRMRQSESLPVRPSFTESTAQLLKKNLIRTRHFHTQLHNRVLLYGDFNAFDIMMWKDQL